MVTAATYGVQTGPHMSGAWFPLSSKQASKGSAFDLSLTNSGKS